jgi:ATPase subunit of ABC transporter with duplicated ATPase domains
LPSIERLEAALRAFPGALVVVSHDPRFLAGAFDATWTLRGGGVDLA